MNGRQPQQMQIPREAFERFLQLLCRGIFLAIPNEVSAQIGPGEMALRVVFHAKTEEGEDTVLQRDICVTNFDGMNFSPFTGLEPCVFETWPPESVPNIAMAGGGAPTRFARKSLAPPETKPDPEHEIDPEPGADPAPASKIIVP